MTPLVSCIMPTRDRPEFAARAVRYFLQQDYPRKELIVLDDSSGGPVSQAFACPEVRYFYESQRRALGDKRNRAVELSGGEIVLHWDDDDWMSRRRISLEVEALLGSGADICGLDRMLFYEMRSRRTWLYHYPAAGKSWLAGGSLCYPRRVWEGRRFKPLMRGEDTHFVWAAPQMRLYALLDITFYVALIHPGNTCPKSLCEPCWKPWTGPGFQEIAGDDWGNYAAIRSHAAGGAL